eukprot:TRINITY_DN55996_c0_g1_i1.p1 TRINITY_DN55996_c0_g1~~TRINITY_DN55996_c0_g1_i1.p1  ORF type:complete len:224 (-),score=21.00 TRINITY_DN55996_c0_g1_i1:128-736(-)
MAADLSMSMSVMSNSGFGGPHFGGSRSSGRPARGMDGSRGFEKSLTSTGFHPNYLRQSLYGSSTAIGDCRLESTGFVLPTDSKHAPVDFYRSYGEWFERGLPQPQKNPPCTSKTSRYWPYGQDVTKLYQTGDKRHKFQLDDRCIQAAKPFVPPRAGSLPHLHTMRDTMDNTGSSWRGARWSEGLDSKYHSTLRDKFQQWPKS